MGYVFDPSIQRVRSISGFPGASVIDGPADLGITPALAAVSPRQDFVLLSAGDDGSVRLITLPSLEAHDVDGAATAPTRILFSPDGSAAALFQPAPARMQIFTHLPQAPALSREITLAGISGDIVSAAISDDGEVAVLLSGNVGKTVAWLSAGGSDPVPFGLPSGTAAVAFRSASHQAATVTQDGQITLLADPASGSDARILWSADIRTTDPASTRFSPDGSAIYVATRGGSLAAIRIDTGEAAFASCSCEPSGLFPLLGGTLFRLNEISDGPLMLVDTAGTQLRTWFVPALERSAQ